MSKMSLLVTVRGALAMMQREVSSMSIGLTPEFLSRAMRQHAYWGEIHLGSMRIVHRHLAVRARE